MSPKESTLPRAALVLQSHCNEKEFQSRSVEVDEPQIQSEKVLAGEKDGQSPEQNASVSVPSDIKPGNAQCALGEIHSESSSHVFRPSRTLRDGADQEGAASTEPRCDKDVVRGTGPTSDLVRRSQEGSEVLRGDCQRSQLLQVVPEEMGQQSQTGASGVQPLPEDVDRAPRDGTGRQSSASRRHLNGQFTSVPQSQSSGWHNRWSLLNDDHRLGERGGRMVGPSESDITNSPSRIRECQAPRSDRRGTERSDRTAQVADAAEDRRNMSVASSAQTFMIEQCIREYNQYVSKLGNSKFLLTASSSRDPYQTNSVLQEMIQFGIQKGWIDKSGKLLGPQQPGIDLLEVYCSSESQLTGQSIQQGMRAKRFGLQQGNLCYYEGRCKLYEELFQNRPRNVWLSPKCKAWCRWSQFNACKSPEMAQKVIEAQSQDLIHLLICEAVFVFQRDRGQAYHCHLEQPVGSEMLHQDAMQIIVEQSLRARCDFCNAGSLKHPTTQQFMQKGTQILTTSMIMHQYVSSLKCPRNHEHTHVAGNFKRSDGTWGPVSEYTELYTRVFGRRIARTILASKQVHETSFASQNVVFHANDGDSEPEAKRRRLNGKISNPPGYAEPSASSANPASEAVSENMPPPVPDITESVKQILTQALQIAPRVGTVCLEDGDLFDSLQAMFPERTIRVIELCKGADRFRKPPGRMTIADAPWRLSLGLHRHDLSPLPLQSWENCEKMSHRRMCSKAPPTRILVTMFGRDASIKRSSDVSQEPAAKRTRTDEGNNTGPIVDLEYPRPNHDEVRSPRIKTPISAESSQDLEQLERSTLKHGPKFLELDAPRRQWLSKIHHNLGHPNAAKLQAVLRSQGYDDCLIQGLSDFHCDTCHELQEPRIARPAHLSEPREFNDCIGCDLVTWTAKSGKTYQFLHCIDVSTSFQIAQPVFQTDATSLFEVLKTHWFAWAGPCRQMVIDNGSAFCAEQFSQHAQGMDIHLRVVAAYAHWQMGKVERHGEILQHMLERFDQNTPIENDDQFKDALLHLCNAKNSMSRTKGYSPEILVLGKSRALPGGLPDEMPQPSHYLADSESPEGIQFRQQLQRREQARMAFVHAESSEKLRRAFLRRQRPHRGSFHGGMFVMFWRPGRGENPGQWTGPARVIVQEGPHVVWVSFSSRVYRVAPEHIRCLSEREASASLDVMSQGDMSFPPKDPGKGVFQYEDLTEVMPPPADFPQGDTPDEQLNPNGTNGNQPTESNLSQPDSEPNQNISPTVSSGYSATPPLSEAQFPIQHPGAPEIDPSELHTIPIPDANEEGLVAEDFWIHSGSQLIRVHQKVRHQAFDPTTVDDCPVDILMISGERTTSGRSVDDQIMWSQTDQWGTNDSQWEKPQTWTGITMFYVISEVGQPEPEPADIMCMTSDQALECEVFLTEHDIDRIANNLTNSPHL